MFRAMELQTPGVHILLYAQGLGEFIIGVLILPTLYCVFWFGVLGSEGIRMQMAADRNEVDCTLALVQHEKELRAPDDIVYISEKESEEKEA